MIVKLKHQQPSYPDLSPEQHYCVLGIEADDYRLLNDLGKPYLYGADLFDVVEHTEPDDWITEFGDDGERYAYPTPLNQPGFFEDFFDHKPEQMAIFWRVVNQRLVQAA